jgi:hypothetical protein
METIIDQIRYEASRGYLKPIPISLATVYVLAIMNSLASGGILSLIGATVADIE